MSAAADPSREAEVEIARPGASRRVRAGPHAFRRATRRTLALVETALLALVAGCAAPGPADPLERPPLALEIGPEFVVLDQPVSRRVAALGPDGRVHVLALTAEDRSVQHVVVDAQGPVSRETILRGVEVDSSVIALPGPHNNLAAAFDAGGTLHTVFRQQHLAFRDGRWSEPGASPPCERLVRSGPTVHCLYRETGGEHGAAMRLQWYFIAPSPVPLPIPQRNTKLLLACRSPTEWITWAIVEPQEGRDVEGFGADADGAGAVQVIYMAGATTNLFGGTSLVMVARTARVAACDEDLKRKGIVGVPGLSTKLGSRRGTAAIATDRISGDSLVLITGDGGYVHSLTLVDGAIANQRFDLWKRDPLKEDFWAVSLAAADGGTFHAMVTTNRATSHYLRYASGKWSQAAQVFATRTTSFVALGPDRLLVIGLNADRKQLVAKWLTVSSRP
ncbi:MAG TPA: hypothetical protein PLB41_08590 [Rubrivivax sp.]|nr:hypothetical protein [Rubrivivax sp.]HPO18626.1 hypothetical protein [Rubrivivax sp.]